MGIRSSHPSAHFMQLLQACCQADGMAPITASGTVIHGTRHQQVSLQDTMCLSTMWQHFGLSWNP